MEVVAFQWPALLMQITVKHVVQRFVLPAKMFPTSFLDPLALMLVLLQGILVFKERNVYNVQLTIQSVKSVESDLNFTKRNVSQFQLQTVWYLLIPQLDARPVPPIVIVFNV
jgi:hypothetical protein